MRLRRNPVVLAACGSIALVAIFASHAHASVDGGIGVGFLSPHGGEVSDLYDPGISFHGSLGFRIDTPPSSIALEGGYYQSDAPIVVPFFTGSTRSELRWIPIDLIARIRLVERPNIAPYLGFGYELLISRESFTYDLGGISNEQQPDSRLDSGFLLVAGIDRPIGPRLRLEGYWSLVKVERSVSRGSGEYRPVDASDVETGMIGLRVLWRLP